MNGECDTDGTDGTDGTAGRDPLGGEGAPAGATDPAGNDGIHGTGVEDGQPDAPGGQRLKPWQEVRSSDVREAIRGTGIERIVNALASVTRPPLPLEITLPKALALAGTALSQPCTRDWNKETDEWGNPKQGAALLRLGIRTAGGQACNVWAMTVADSGTGKDIGGLPARLASRRKWLIGSSGSAEGLKDAFAETGSGLLIVSELGPFLNPKRWQHSCTEFLVSAFNQGWFAQGRPACMDGLGLRRHGDLKRRAGRP